MTTMGRWGAVALTVIVGCGDTGAPEGVGRATAAVTLRDLGAAPPPVVLPLGPAGTRFRVSQRGNDVPSHGASSTLEATDWSATGHALAPVSGTVRRYACGADSGRACNGGWGNLVELQGLRTGETFVFAHCASFLVADGAFVVRGTPLCVIGTTGNSSGVHLHFDRVSGTRLAYRSVGARYFTSTDGAEAAVLDGRGFRTCCSSGCDAATGSAGCVQYASFLHPLLDVTRAFVDEHRAADPSITAVVGDPTPVAASSDATWTAVRQRVVVTTGGAARGVDLYAYHGSFAGNGLRNPLVDTGWTMLWDSASGRMVGSWRAHSRVHPGPAVAFDLWDTLRVLVPADVRDAVPVPRRITSWPAWTPSLELHGATVAAGGRDWTAYVAVSRSLRGVRWGIAWLGDRWSPWVEL